MAWFEFHFLQIRKWYKYKTEERQIIGFLTNSKVIYEQKLLGHLRTKTVNGWEEILFEFGMGMKKKNHVEISVRYRALEKMRI